MENKTGGEGLKNRYLFLFGGSPPFNRKLGKKFADSVLKGNGKTAILFIEREGWKGYMPKYTGVLKENGLTKFAYIPLSANPEESLLQQLSSSTGVIICGGETERYRNYIVNTPMGKQIKEMYQQGVPVAGFSAGALICPEDCVISPKDNSKNKQLFLEGLGLLKKCVISVHYTKWDEEGNLKTALEKVNALIGYGIDDEGSLYFENEILVGSESENFYSKEARV